MLLTIQQKYLLTALRKLGGARRDQLVALFRPAFCAQKPESADWIAGTALHRLQSTNQLRESEGVYYLTNAPPTDDVLEAIDVMLDLSQAQPLDFQRGREPVLLRFSVQEQKVRRFVVARHGVESDDLNLGAYERVILLFDGQGKGQPLPVSNKQFYAIRQEGGTHRYYAVNAP